MDKKRRLTLMIILALTVCFALATLAQAAVIVVNFGKYASALEAAQSEASVNWTDGDAADDTICTASFAALELQHYLRLMSGDAQAFSIAGPVALYSAGVSDLICLGTCAQLGSNISDSLGLSDEAILELGSDGYALKTLKLEDRQILFIAAPTRKGLLYGTYDLLHRLGVRWYAPGELHENVPGRSLEPFPAFDVLERPRFLTRGFHAWENRADKPFLLWMARNRLNYWCVEQDDKPFLHKLGLELVGGAHVLTSYYLGPLLEYPYDHPLFPGDDGKPLDPYAVSPEYQGDADGDGRLSYFEAHPEWCGLREGHRSPNIEGDFGDNFCTSNREAMAEWTKNAVQDLIDGRYRDAGFMNAWTLDYGNWCECPVCRALGTPTDRNILFVHAYAQAIKKAQADKRINRTVRLLFLAYGDVIEPPTRPLPEDFDYEMCIATFFPIRRCYVHAIDAPDCSVNAAYLKHFWGWFLDEERYYRGQVCIGEYYNVSGYKCLPACFKRTMATDIPYYESAMARHFHYMHVTTRNWGSRALTNWQMARELWNPATPAEEIWEDYFGGRYGPAREHMQRFYDSLEKMLSNITELKYTLARRLENGEEDLFPNPHLRYEITVYKSDDGPDFLEMLEYARGCRRLIAETAALNLPERIAQRVAEDERAFLYAERTLYFYDALCRAQFFHKTGSGDKARAAILQARKLAGLLAADTVSTKLSSSHANAADALEASFAAPALARLEEAIGVLPKRD